MTADDAVTRVRDYYDAIAEGYDRHEHEFFWTIADALLESLLEAWVPSNSDQWLDIGGGTGHWTLWLHGHTGVAPALVDVSAGMARIAERRMRDVGRDAHWRATIASASSLPFPAASFGGAVCLNNVLGIVARPTDVLAEAARVLRPGGALVMSYVRPEPAARHMLLAGHPEAAAQIFSHGTCSTPWGGFPLRCFETSDLHAAVRSAGFDVERDIGFPRLIAPHADIERSLQQMDVGVVLEKEREHLGLVGDELAYTRVLHASLRGERDGGAR